MEPFDAGEIVGVRQVLDAPLDDLLAGVAEDVALPLVDAKPSTLEIEMADTDTGVLEGPSEPLLTFPQGCLRALPFLGLVEGLVGSASLIAEVVAPGPAQRLAKAADQRAAQCECCKRDYGAGRDYIGRGRYALDRS